MKLLIVDDSAMVRRLIEAAYRGSVFTEIQTAADGILAVTMYKQFNPDVVTLDITMPHMDGLAALGQILEHNPNAKVLVVSALADHHTAIDSLKRGASQFICKPFSAEDLRLALDEVMNPPSERRSRSRRRKREAAARARGAGPTSSAAPATPSFPRPNPAIPAEPSASHAQDPSQIAPSVQLAAPSALPPDAAPLPTPSEVPMDNSEVPHSEIPPSPENYPSGYVRPPVRPPMPLSPPSDNL